MQVYRSDLKELGDSISSCILEEFDNPKSLKTNDGRLIKRFNNSKPRDNEWTVISGIVALVPQANCDKNGHHDEDSSKRRKLNGVPTIIPLTLTSGVKTIPDVKFESDTKGRILHDLHAEILSIRMFNYTLLKEVERWRVDQTSGLIQFDEASGKFTLKDGITLGMYISELPCGDCSLEYLKKNSKDTKSWEIGIGTNSNEDSKDQLLRGREHFNRSGRVRTKPGRKDSPFSSSKSCSDKLSLRQFKSLLNSMTCKLFDVDSFYLKYLVLPQDKIDADDLQRCFHDRLSGYEKKIMGLTSYSFHPMTIIPTTNVFKLDKTARRKKTCDISILYSPFAKELETCNKGIKNGCDVNHSPFIKPQDQCSISRESMFKLYRKVSDIGDDDEEEEDTNDYYKFKEKIKKRYDMIKSVKSTVFQGWNGGIYDNFTLD